MGGAGRCDTADVGVSEGGVDFDGSGARMGVARGQDQSRYRLFAQQGEACCDVVFGRICGGVLRDFPAGADFGYRGEGIGGGGLDGRVR